MNKEQKHWRPGDAYEPLQVIEQDIPSIGWSDFLAAVKDFLIDWLPFFMVIIGFGILLTGCAVKPHTDIYKQCWISAHDGYQRCQCRGGNGQWVVCP